MKTRILNSILFVLTASSLFVCCVNDDYKEPESTIKTYVFSANKSVKSVSDNAPSTINVTSLPYSNDDIIEGYVTSSDETGNFYNTISFQTIPTDGSAPVGFSVSVDLKSSTEGFTPGRKAYIKLKGLFTKKEFGSLKIGAFFENGIGRIANYDWKKYLFPSSTIVDENSFVRTVSITQAALDVNINTLLEINNVQFSDESLLRTYYDVDNGGAATNHKISDINGSVSKFLRVSEFSLFASQKIPFGKGKIRGVMSKFNNDYQFIIRSTNDVKLNTERVYNFPGSITENFNSYPATSSSYSIGSYIAFSNYINFFTVGKKNWYVKSGGYLGMSAFGGDIENAKSYFLMPINMTAANTLQFKINTNFYTGGLGLKVYRTTDYIPGTSISNATLTDITSFFTLPTNSTSFTSTPVFVNSGVYNIPAGVTGNGYFVFEYAGTNISTGPALTTGVDIDDIVIN